MNAQQLKNSILQEAIEGRLVPQDPNDEPASVLLDKIRKEKAKLVKEKKLKKSALKEDPFTDDDKLFAIPVTWAWCKLGWIGDWGAGTTPAKGTPEFYTNGTIPWLRTGELNNGIVTDSEIKVTPYALQKCSLRECKVGDVLIAMYGATIGKVAIAGIELTTNQACCACTPYQVYNKYLLYYLMANKQRFIDLGEGGAQPNISREKIVAFPFPLPPLAEQKRIVAKIEELMPKVEEYGKAQEALDKLNEELPERLKKSILQEAITGRLVPQDPNDEPASVLLDKIRAEKKRLVKEGKLKKKDLEETPISEDEKPFEIPESWDWVRIKTIFDVCSARRVHEKDWRTSGIPFYRAREIGKLADNGFVDNDLFIDQQLYDEFSQSGVPKEGDLMITAVGTLGKVYIVKEGEIFYYKDGSVLCMENKWRINPQYAKYVIESPVFINQYIGESQGTTVATLTMVRVNQYLFPLPPLAEQKRIVDKIEQLIKEIDKLKQ